MKTKPRALEKPAIFNGEMVRATLAGRKTQTRRLDGLHEINKDPDSWYYDGLNCVGKHLEPNHIFHNKDTGETVAIKPRYWPGLYLWVRETFCIESNRDVTDISGYDPPFNDGRPVNFVDDLGCATYWEQPHYRATDPVPELDIGEEDPGCKWTPSIFMPRWASRILVRVTKSIPERVQDISEEDAKAEGVKKYGDEDCWKIYTPTTSFGTSSPISSFRSLWDSINGGRKVQTGVCTSSQKDGAAANLGWDANPWCFANTFEVVES